MTRGAAARGVAAFLFLNGAGAVAESEELRATPNPGTAVVSDAAETPNPPVAGSSAPERASESESAASPPEEDPRRARAEEHRQRAIRFYDRNNLAASREEFELAYRTLPSYRLLYNLGIVSMALGDSPAAYDYFERFLLEGGNQIPEERRQEAERQLLDLTPHVASMELKVRTEGAEVRVDGALLGFGPLDRSLRLKVGRHRVVARAFGRSSVRIVELSAGKTLQLELEVQRPPPPPPPPDAARTRLLIAGWCSTGLLAAGAVFAGVKAISAQRDYERKLESLDVTRHELDDADAETERWAIATDVLTGGAIVSGALSLYLTLSSSDTRRAAPIVGSRVVEVDWQHLPRQARVTWKF